MKKAVRYIGYTFQDCYRAFPRFFVLTYLLDGTGTACEVFVPLLLARILELAGEGQGGKELAAVIGLYGLALACGPVLEVFFRASSKRARVLGKKYFGSRLAVFSAKIRLEALEDPDTLDKFHRAEGGENSQFIFFEQVNLALRKLATCGGMMMVVGRYSPVLVVTGLLALLPALSTKIYFEKKITSFRRGQSPVLRRCQYLRGLFANRETVKEMRVMGFERHVTQRWEEANRARLKEFQETELDVRRKQVWGIIVMSVCYVVNIGVAFFLMAGGRISVGAFAACLAAFSAYDASIQMLIAMVFNAVHTYRMVEDYYDYFTIPTEVEGDLEYRPFEEKIAVQDVHFRYSGAAGEALDGLTCEIKKGEHVVVVGENGSGKTTFSKLLTGAYLPSRGSISYDGQRTEDLRRGSLYEHISVVPQDFVRYRFTLGENVGISSLKRMGDTKAMEELLAQVAGEGFLEKVGGLDVQLGREFGGQELSGGEWQKVAIARGLWKRSSILVLDEPTSALDPLVEYEILSRFVEMIQDRTSVIISHRVGICRSADKIIVMKDGRMVECGKHQELLAREGEYARIWREQAKWYV